MSRQSQALKGLTSKRAQDTARGRLLLGAFVVAWLNLAVQPCLMAMESAPEPAVASGHSTHAGHSVEHDCDHCPPALSDHATACASSAAADCSSIPDYNNDGRNGASKLKDIPTFVAIADSAIPIEITTQTISPPSSNCGVLHYPSEVPINIRFCVFLK